MKTQYKHFKDENNKVYGLDVNDSNKDTWEEEIKAKGWVEISREDAIKIANPPATKEQLTEQADQQKQVLTTEANQKTQLWQTQLMLDIITAEDKASLTEWMLYVQKVQAVDTSAAPDIIWPEKPE